MEKCEQELVIRIAEDESFFTCTSTSPRWTRHLKKISQKVGGFEVEMLGAEVYRVRLPRERINILTAKRVLNLSTEELERRRERGIKLAGKDSALSTALEIIKNLGKG